MTGIERTALSEKVKKLLAGDGDLLKTLIKEALQEVLEGEMTEFLGAEPGVEDAGHGGRATGAFIGGSFP